VPLGPIEMSPLRAHNLVRSAARIVGAGKRVLDVSGEAIDNLVIISAAEGAARRYADSTPRNTLTRVPETRKPLTRSRRSSDPLWKRSTGAKSPVGSGSGPRSRT